MKQTAILYPIYIFIVIACLLAESCTVLPVSENARAGSDLAIAVWDSPAGERTKQFASSFTQTTGITVSVFSFPEWQYRNLVEARLLAGTSPWDVVYLKGGWVPELVMDNSLKDMTSLIPPEPGNWAAISEFRKDNAMYGLPVDASLPFLFYRKDQIPSDLLSSFDTTEGFLEMLDSLALPSGEYQAGAALGDIEREYTLLPYNNYIAHSQYITKNSSNDIENLVPILNQFCNLKASHIFAPDSIGWGQADLVAALKEGKIAAAVLWSNDGEQLLKCTQNGPACKGGESMIGFRPFPATNWKGSGRIPRLINAWAIPWRPQQSSASGRWVQWVSSTEGQKIWQELGGIPLGNIDQNLTDRTSASLTESIQTLFFASDPAIGLPGSEKLQARFSQNFQKCLYGTLSPEQILSMYSQDVAGYMKQMYPTP